MIIIFIVIGLLVMGCGSSKTNEYINNYIKKESYSQNDKVQELIVNARIKFTNHKYKLAIQDLDKAYALEPNNIKIIVLRAYCYSNTEQYHQAIDDLSKAIVLNKNNNEDFKSENYYMVRSNAYEHIMNYQRSIDDLSIVIEIYKSYILKQNRCDDNYVNNLTRRANLYNKIGNRLLAEKDLEELIKYRENPYGRP